MFVAITVYLLVAIGTTPFIARWLLRDQALFGPISSVDVAWAYLLGLCLSFFWPLGVLLIGLYRLLLPVFESERERLSDDNR